MASNAVVFGEGYRRGRFGVVEYWMRYIRTSW